MEDLDLNAQSLEEVRELIKQATTPLLHFVIMISNNELFDRYQLETK